MDRIVGVKAIADYLEISIRNLYRWERELGLPLHRISGSKGRSVYIFKEELDEWLKQKKQIKTHKKWPSLFIIGFLIPLLAILIIYVLHNKNDSFFPLTYTINGDIVSIKNLKGETIWSYLGSDKKNDELDWETGEKVDFFDIDYDDANEVVTKIYNSTEDKFYLVLFDNDGKTLWKRRINTEQKFNGINLKSDFFPMAIKFVNLSDGTKNIITCWAHRVRFLSVISAHDCEGNLINLYHHTGCLGSMRIHDLDSDGNEEILFAGTNNLLNGEAVLGVLSVTNFKGVSPPCRIETEYKDISFRLKPYIANNPEFGNQLLYLRFKKDDYLKTYQKVHVFAYFNNIDNEMIHVLIYPWTIEQQNLSFGFLYTFNNRFFLKDTIAAPEMVKIYPALLSRNEIKINLDEMIEIYSKNILKWENNSWIPINNKFNNDSIN